MDDPQANNRPLRRRRLRHDEIELWHKVAKTIEARKDAILPELPELMPLPTRAPTEKPLAKRREPTAPSYTPPISGPKMPAPPLAPLERRLKQQLLRGRSNVDQVLDLHGMTQAHAHGSLQQFLHRAQADGARLVLVITGKGRTAGASNDFEFEVGVLRRQVPHWLKAPDLRSIVIGFQEAGPAHGGTGALYVRIRKADRCR